MSLYSGRGAHSRPASARLPIDIPSSPPSRRTHSYSSALDGDSASAAAVVRRPLNWDDPDIEINSNPRYQHVGSSGYGQHIRPRASSQRMESLSDRLQSGLHDRTVKTAISVSLTARTASKWSNEENLNVNQFLSDIKATTGTRYTEFVPPEQIYAKPLQVFEKELKSINNVLSKSQPASPSASTPSSVPSSARSSRPNSSTRYHPSHALAFNFTRPASQIAASEAFDKEQKRLKLIAQQKMMAHRPQTARLPAKQIMKATNNNSSSTRPTSGRQSVFEQSARGSVYRPRSARGSVYHGNSDESDSDQDNMWISQMSNASTTAAQRLYRRASSITPQSTLATTPFPIPHLNLPTSPTGSSFSAMSSPNPNPGMLLSPSSPSPAFAPTPSPFPSSTHSHNPIAARHAFVFPLGKQSDRALWQKWLSSKKVGTGYEHLEQSLLINSKSSTAAVELNGGLSLGGPGQRLSGLDEFGGEEFGNGVKRELIELEGLSIKRQDYIVPNHTPLQWAKSGDIIIPDDEDDEARLNMEKEMKADANADNNDDPFEDQQIDVVIDEVERRKRIEEFQQQKIAQIDFNWVGKEVARKLQGTGLDISKDYLDVMHSLHLFQKVWLACDERGFGLSENQFVDFLSNCSELDKPTLQTLFEKMDVNSDGSLSWDEYISYLVRELAHKWKLGIGNGTFILNQRANRVLPMRDAVYAKNILVVPAIGNPLYPTYAGKYIVTCKDDTIEVWDSNHLTFMYHLPLRAEIKKRRANYFDEKEENSKGDKNDQQEDNFMQSNYKEKKNENKHSLVLVPAGKSYMPGLIAEAVPVVTKETARFGQAPPPSIVPKTVFREKQLARHTNDFPITSVSYYARQKQVVVAAQDRSIRFFGLVFRQYELLNRFYCHDTPQCLLVETVSSETVPGLSPFDKPRNLAYVGSYMGGISVYNISNRSRIALTDLHDEQSVRKIELMPHVGLISAGMDGRLAITDPSYMQLVRHLGGSLVKQDGTFTKKSGHKSGIHSFACCPTYRCIVSAGYDRSLLLWDPHVPTPTWKLHNHSSDIVDVVVNEEKNQIISVSSDKKIRIFDIRSFKMIEELVDSVEYHPDDELTAAAFDVQQQRLITAGNKMTLWGVEAAPSNRASYQQHAGGTAHVTGIAFIGYSHTFQQVVSVSETENVRVWSIMSGKHVFEFSTNHKAQVTGGCLDQQGKRLFTCAHNGSAKMWNFNNGELLYDFESRSTEINRLVYISNLATQPLAGTGWEKNVIRWAAPEKEQYGMMEQKGHKCAILSLAYAQNIIVTGDAEGMLIAWNVDSGAISHKLLLPQQAKPKSKSADQHSNATDDAHTPNISALGFADDPLLPPGISALSFVTLLDEDYYTYSQNESFYKHQYLLLVVGTDDGTVHFVNAHQLLIIRSHFFAVDHDVKGLAVLQYLVQAPIQRSRANSKSHVIDPYAADNNVHAAMHSNPSVDAIVAQVYAQGGVMDHGSESEAHVQNQPGSRRGSRKFNAEDLAALTQSSSKSSVAKDDNAIHIHRHHGKISHHTEDNSKPTASRSSSQYSLKRNTLKELNAVAASRSSLHSSSGQQSTAELDLTAPTVKTRIMIADGEPNGLIKLFEMKRFTRGDFECLDPIKSWLPHHECRICELMGVDEPLLTSPVFITGSDKGHLFVWSVDGDLVANFGQKADWPAIQCSHLYQLQELTESLFPNLDEDADQHTLTSMLLPILARALLNPFRHPTQAASASGSPRTSILQIDHHYRGGKDLTLAKASLVADALARPTNDLPAAAAAAAANVAKQPPTAAASSVKAVAVSRKGSNASLQSVTQRSESSYGWYDEGDDDDGGDSVDDVGASGSEQDELDSPRSNAEANALVSALKTSLSKASDLSDSSEQSNARPQIQLSDRALRHQSHRQKILGVMKTRYAGSFKDVESFHKAKHEKEKQDRLLCYAVTNPPITPDTLKEGGLRSQAFLNWNNPKLKKKDSAAADSQLSRDKDAKEKEERDKTDSESKNRLENMLDDLEGKLRAARDVKKPKVPNYMKTTSSSARQQSATGATTNTAPPVGFVASRRIVRPKPTSSAHAENAELIPDLMKRPGFAPTGGGLTIARQSYGGGGGGRHSSVTRIAARASTASARSPSAASNSAHARSSIAAIAE